VDGHIVDGLSARKIAISGAAGFIGYHLVSKLLASNVAIGWLGDSLQPSYGGNLSVLRANSLLESLKVEEIDLASLPPEEVAERIAESRFLVHLAASPGVRAGELDPVKTFKNNVGVFQTMLAAAESAEVEAVLYASSSSVYGDAGVQGACSEVQADGKQAKSWYATTKWINEIQARDFTRRTGIPTVALRFFTVYGSYGRPDMAYFTFAEALRSGQPVTIYGSNGGSRDFTHVSDTVHAMSELIRVGLVHGSEILPPAVNIATGRPASTLDLVDELALNIGVSDPQITHLVRPSVDAEATYADTELLQGLIGSWPTVGLKQGIAEFVDWWQSTSSDSSY